MVGKLEDFNVYIKYIHTNMYPVSVVVAFVRDVLLGCSLYSYTSYFAAEHSNCNSMDTNSEISDEMESLSDD